MNNKIVIYTDGGSRRNPGPSAIGVWIETLDKRLSLFLGDGTNNEAEYKAIEFALKKLHQIIGKSKAKSVDVVIMSDSELVVKQLNGKYKLKKESLFDLFISINNLKQEFNSVRFMNIPREENKIADSLVNKELDNN